MTIEDAKIAEDLSGKINNLERNIKLARDDKCVIAIGLRRGNPYDSWEEIDFMQQLRPQLIDALNTRLTESRQKLDAL